MTAQEDSYKEKYVDWPHPAVGRFRSLPCITAARRAMLVIERLSKGVPSDTTFESLLDITHQYKIDVRNENKRSLPRIRAQCRELTVRIESLERKLLAFGRQSISFVCEDYSVDSFSPYDMGVLVNLLKKLRFSASKPIPRQRKTSKTALKKAFASVVALRAQIEGREFASSWEEQANVNGVPVAFKANDANFVLEVLNAIDRNVKFSHVRSIGKNWRKPDSRNK